MANTFSLLRLPSLALQNVIRTMDCCDKIAISMCTQKMKNLVRLLNFRAKRFRMYINGYEFGVVSDEARIRIELLPVDDAPGSFKIFGMLWDCTARSLKDWMEHLKYIYKCNRYALLFVCGKKYDVNRIRKEFDQLELDEIRLIDKSIPDKYCIDVLHTFLPVKELMINKNPFHTREALRSIICRPFDSLMLDMSFSTSIIELININAIDVTCWRCDITEEDLNLFFKLWIHGEYPRLKDMYLVIVNNNITEMKVLEEIEYQEEMKNKEDKVKKAYWIKNLDGKKAAIRFMKLARCTHVDFNVYN